MPTIDLSTPPPTPPSGLLEALPRRVTLTLPELRLVAERAGGAPLPFDDLVAPAGTHPLDSGRGESSTSVEDAAYAGALGALHDPEATLTRRGLLGGPVVADGLAGAVGLLATPTTALDIDVTAAGVRARSWHRHAGDAVATLSTVDGVVFELAWFPATQWASELGRAAILPTDLEVRASEVPPHVEVPFELADAATEAIRSGRGDLLPVLAARHTGSVVDDRGPLADPAVTALLHALAHEARGRLRVLVAHVAEGEPTVVGVVSWTLLADGWHALRPRELGAVHRVVVSAVEPSDLAPELAPVLAEVTR
jgi:hypothetical protein